MNEELFHVNKNPIFTWNPSFYLKQHMLEKCTTWKLIFLSLAFKIFVLFIILKSENFSHNLFSGKLKVCMFLEKIVVYDLVYHACVQQNSLYWVKMIKNKNQTLSIFFYNLSHSCSCWHIATRLIKYSILMLLYYHILFQMY